MPFGGTTSIGRLRDRARCAAAHGGTTTIVDFAIQTKGGSLRAGARHVAREGRGQGARSTTRFHMIMTDVPTAGRSTEMGAIVREGVTSFKMFMAYPGVFLVDDQSDLPRDAARRRARRAHLHARRERAADRRARRSARSRRATPRRSITRSRAREVAEADGHRARDRARRDGQGAGVHRAPLGAARARARDGGARPRPAGVRRDLPAVPVPLARTTCAASRATSSRAPSTCARRRCGPKHHQEHLWRGLRNHDLRSSRPTTARSA